MKSMRFLIFCVFAFNAHRQHSDDDERQTLFPTKRYLSLHPTMIPSKVPSNRATNKPNTQASNKPTTQPSNKPTAQPSNKPTTQPSNKPTAQPSNKPTTQPSNKPITQPSDKPTTQPSLPFKPTTQPSNKPSIQDTDKPTYQPSLPFKPTCVPSPLPTTYQNQRPSKKPTFQKTKKPTHKKPTKAPTYPKTKKPTAAPTSCNWAFAKTDHCSTCFLNQTIQHTTQWGWSTGPLLQDKTVFLLYMNAYDCLNGIVVGNVTFTYTSHNKVIVSYAINGNYTLKNTSLYVGPSLLPLSKNVHPAKYPYHPKKKPEYKGHNTYELCVKNDRHLYMIAFATICKSDF